MSDCPRSETVVDLLEGFLEGDELRAAEAHVDQCPACSEARDAYRQLWGDLEALPTPAPSPEAKHAAHAAVLAAMAADAPGSDAPTEVAPAPAVEVPREGGRVIPWPLLAAAACLLLALPLSQLAFDGTPRQNLARTGDAAPSAVPQAPPREPSPQAPPPARQREAAKPEPRPVERSSAKLSSADAESQGESADLLDAGASEADQAAGPPEADLAAGEAPGAEEDMAETEAEGEGSKQEGARAEGLNQASGRELRRRSDEGAGAAELGFADGAAGAAPAAPAAGWVVTRSDAGRHAYAWSAGELRKVPRPAAPPAPRAAAPNAEPADDADDAPADGLADARAVARLDGAPLREALPAESKERAALSARELSAEEAEDLTAILRFELGQPREGAWPERVRTLLELLLGHDVTERDPAALERLARSALNPELFLEEQLERRAAPDAPVQAR